MKVQILNDDGRVIWERGKEKGVACRSFVKDGTQQEIIELLAEASEQAKIELICFDDVD